ncbi:hypothetical protein FRC11_002025, partial [Ceratobasidium sp. 423]
VTTEPLASPSMAIVPGDLTLHFTPDKSSTPHNRLRSLVHPKGTTKEPAPVSTSTS